MTDKEIIIDGVDVAGCCALDINERCNGLYFCEGEICSFKYDSLLEYRRRKEQECEALKETINKFSQGIILPMPEIEIINLTDRYKQALEEIEGIAKDINITIMGGEGSPKDEWINLYTTTCVKILAIINEVKNAE